jgi:hypothetical protein
MLTEIFKILVTGLITGLISESKEINSSDVQSVVAKAADALANSFSSLILGFLVYKVYKISGSLGKIRTSLRLQGQDFPLMKPQMMETDWYKKLTTGTLTTYDGGTEQDAVDKTPETAPSTTLDKPVGGEDTTNAAVVERFSNNSSTQVQKDQTVDVDSCGQVFNLDNQPSGLTIVTEEKASNDPYNVNDTRLKKYDFTRQVMKLKSFDWVSTNAAQASLVKINFQTLTNQPVILRLASMYTCFRFDIKLTVVVQGNPMSIGTLIAGSIPKNPTGNSFYWKVADEPSVNAFANLCNCPHTLIDSHVSGTYEFIIPYTYNTEWIGMAGAACLTKEQADQGSLTLAEINWFLFEMFVLYNYRPPTGNTVGVRVEIYGQLINLEYNTPKPQIYVSAKSYEGEDYGSYSGDAADFTRLLLATIERPDKIKRSIPWLKEQIFDFGTTTVSSINLSDIKKSNVPLTTQSDSLTASVPGSLEYDAPANQSNYDPVLVKMNQVMGYDKSPIVLQKISNQPERLYTIDKSSMKKYRLLKDEMTISSFEGRRIFVKTATIPLAQAVNSLLFYGYGCIAPQAYTKNIDLTAAPIYGTYVPTSFMNILSGGSSWQGDVNFHVRFHSNNFISAKILMTATPLTIINPAANLDTNGELDWRSIPHIIHDVGLDDKEVTMTIPYNDFTRTTLTAKGITGAKLATKANTGTFLMYLLSKVSSTNATPTEVGYSIFVSYSNLRLLTPNPVPSLTQQAYVTPYKSNASRLLRMFNELTSLKSLLMRPVFYHSDTIYLIKDANNQFPRLDKSSMSVLLDPIFITTNVIWAQLKNMYLGYKGGMRYIIRTEGCNYTPEGKTTKGSDQTLVRFTVQPCGDLQSYYHFQNLAYSTQYALGCTKMACDGGSANWNTLEGFPTCCLPPIYTNGQGETTMVTSTYSPYSFVMDTRNNTEMVIEIPYHYESTTYMPMPTLNLQPTFNSIVTNSTTTPMLTASFLNAMDNTQVDKSVTISIEAMPADDFQMIHYTGGPVTSYPVYCQYTAGNTQGFPISTASY